MMTALLVMVALAQPAEPVRRFALVAGANDGGRARVTLRYAGSDAAAVSTVLTQLGGVAKGDLVFLEEPRPATLARALEELSARLASARSPTSRFEVIFYYSGHSDETGLLLGEERYAYDELRRRLDALPAEVRIGIVDACASGALTRAKGGVARPPFLVDASTQLKGHAFLTSASIDEAAQESERLKASVFTHALVSGLRGAADASRDGKVTLAEAYQFAFNETLARTASTRSGPQRPAFDIQLAGTGEMVLTDVRAASAQLELSAKLSGRVFILNAAGGLVVEVAKGPGDALQLGVEPGAYRVLVDNGRGGLGETRVSLAERQTLSVEPASLTSVTKDALVTRGDTPRPFTPVDVAFIYPLSIGGALTEPPRTFFSLGVLTAREGAVDGVAISSLGTWVDGAVRGAAVTGIGVRAGGLDGVGLAGVTVVSTGAVRGVVGAPVTVVGGSLHGVAAGAVHVAGAGLSGGQVGAVNVAAGGVRGLQAGAVSVAQGGFTGLQAGAVNVATGGVRGVQVAAVSVAQGGFSGFQAGAANAALGDGLGAQVGVVNVGGDVVGAQVGVLNIASSVKGTQVGVLNIAGESSAPVGLLNVITRGRFRAAVFAGETSVANVSVKLGSKHVYSFGIASYSPWDAGRLGFGLGLGVQVNVGSFYGQLEGDVRSLSAPSRLFSSQQVLTTQRFVVGWQLGEAFSVFAGPSFSQLVSFDGTDPAPLTPWGFSPSSRVRLVPGVTVGVQLF
ncbi:MAG: caspase family protein [Myxococcaceae bacterium]|nr:caspase family protein [Myxococcaceae bacterium]